MADTFMLPRPVEVFQVTPGCGPHLCETLGSSFIVVLEGYTRGFDWKFGKIQGQWDDYLVRFPEPVGVIVMTKEQVDHWFGRDAYEVAAEVADRCEKRVTGMFSEKAASQRVASQDIAAEIRQLSMKGGA